MEVKREGGCQTQGEKGHEHRVQGGGRVREGTQTGENLLKRRLWGHCWTWTKTVGVE